MKEKTEATLNNLRLADNFLNICSLNDIPSQLVEPGAD